MRGSPDRTDQAGHPEPPRWSVAELQQRLQRLPPGHPSSPCNGDGSRKPPVPRLRDLELPLPAQEDTGKPGRPDSADGTWHRKGLALTAEAGRLTERAYDRFAQAEGRRPDGSYTDSGLTPTMRGIEADLEGGQLAGCPEYSLKSMDRLKEKVAKAIRDEPDKPAEQHIAEVHDGIRYTFVFEGEDYAAGVGRARELLADRGYELVVLKNTWASEEYKGINTRWHDQGNGLIFEVQLHTPESWGAKQRTHDAYEKINDTRTPAAERERLRALQQEVSAGVPRPPGCADIPDYRREGW